jgi:hypothetical protein
VKGNGGGDITRKISVFFMIIVVSASMVAFYAPEKALATACATVTLSPSQQDSWMYWGSGSGNGTVYEINVDVVIANVTDMRGWQFGLFWNSSCLNCDSVTIHNPDIWGSNTLHAGDYFDNTYNSTTGYYFNDSAALQGYASFSGTVDIATLTFHQLVNLSATTPLSFDSVEIGNSWGDDIAFSSTDGSVVMHTGGANPTTVTISGNGSTVQLFPYPSNWANWQCSQSNDGDTSYVMSSEEDNNPYRDLYVANCSWIPAGATNITATVHMLVKSNSASRKALCRPCINATSLGVQYGSSCNPSTTYQDYYSSFSIIQSDGSGLQIGVQVTSARYNLYGMYTYYPGYCTQVYAVITWS